ncbi:unnamed protein product [Caenorhabditis angaria]|uniref:Transthyretin-like family protein n=1 Tax=Caenorhabditis angaria TaxID=860376 RepID=A0A9P1IM99_9PELO|nr:unnamed protein product [Caenorhabditis angaria]
MILQFVVLLSLSGFSSQAIFTKSDIAFRTTGQVLCDEEPAPNLEVQLWDLNLWGRDSVHLNSTITDSEGNYELFGKVHDYNLSPHIRVLNHTCQSQPGCFFVSYQNLAERYSDSQLLKWTVPLEINSHIDSSNSFCKR